MSNGQRSWSVFTLVKNFDAYPKIVGFEDFQTKTFSGAVVSLAAFVLMALLFTYEFYDFITPRITEDISVDFSRQHTVSIHFTIVFPFLPCSQLTLDTEDDSGHHQSNLRTNVSKIPLPSNQHDGSDVTDTQTEASSKINDDGKLEDLPKCGSCYGADTPERNCCNTCDEVMENYERRGWVFRPQLFEQCQGEEEKGRLFIGGCNMTGVLSVNRVSGNFHISPGKSLDMNSVHMHVMGDLKIEDVDLSHTIHQLSFEAPVKGQPGPLDNYELRTEKGARSISYYFKVVPTVYEKLDGSSFAAYQFSVTQKNKVFNREDQGGDMPGIIFHYDFSPMMVKYTEERRSIGHFLTGLCAIVGGVYTVASLIDSVIFRCGDALKRKLELGKAG